MSNPPDNDEPFLSRWSRRKRSVARGETAPADGSTATELAGAREGAVTSGEHSRVGGGGDAGGEEELDLSTLPKVEELDEHSDITAFLDKRVPMALRNAALGRMWTLDPTIRDFIEVAENQWNWNIPGGTPFYEPLEGGAEMAEEILSGMGSAVKAVAEAVLPGDGASTLVDGGRVAGAAANAAVPIEGDPVSDVAAHSDPATIAVQSDAPMPVSIRHSQSEPVDVAMRQSEGSGVADDAPRRRHGGALPG